MSRPFEPPPELDGAAGHVAELVLGWPATTCRAHRAEYDTQLVDGLELRVDDRELGHLHFDGELHIGTNRALHDALVTRGLARPSRWNPRSPRVEVSVTREEDVAVAVWLLRLNHDRMRGVPLPVLLERIEARAGLRTAE